MSQRTGKADITSLPCLTCGWDRRNKLGNGHIYDHTVQLYVHTAVEQAGLLHERRPRRDRVKQLCSQTLDTTTTTHADQRQSGLAMRTGWPKNWHRFSTP